MTLLIFANPATLPCMSSICVSLPDELKAFVDEQADRRGYACGSEYVCHLIQREHDKEKLRNKLLEAMASPISDVIADKAYFDSLRAHVRSRAAAMKGSKKGTAHADEK